jgi:hypothetical protein
MRNASFIIAMAAGAGMLALGVAIGRGAVPAEILFLSVGCLGVCAAFAYCLVALIRGGAPAPRAAARRDVPRRYAYRIEAAGQDLIIEGPMPPSAAFGGAPAWTSTHPKRRIP